MFIIKDTIHTFLIRSFLAQYPVIVIENDYMYIKHNFDNVLQFYPLLTIESYFKQVHMEYLQSTCILH